MTTLAHERADGFGGAAGCDTATRLLLERAIAAAESNIPEPEGWLSRLVARDRSAAALVRRYRLLPAIKHAYARVTRKYGPVHLLLTAEEDDADPYIRMEVIAPTEEPDLALQDEIQESLDRFLHPRNQLRLSVFLRGAGNGEADV